MFKKIFIPIVVTFLAIVTFSFNLQANFSVSYNAPVKAAFTSGENPFPDTGITRLEGIAAAELQRRDVISGYPDGEFKGYNFVNRAEAAKFLLLARYGYVVDNLSNNNQFPDVPSNAWYTKYVLKAAQLGVINGYPDGYFQPANTINTVEFLKMLTRTFELKENLEYDYRDVPQNAWYTPYVGTISEYDLFPSRSSSSLNPSQLMTRNEVAVAIYQFLKYQNGTESPEDDTNNNSSTTEYPPLTTNKCTYNGKNYKNDESFQSSDSCSTCHCDEGHVLCEAKSCDWAYESKEVTLKVGNKIKNSKNDKLELMTVRDGRYTDFDVLSLFKGKLIPKIKFTLGPNHGNLSNVNGFYLEFVNSNIDNQTLTVKQYNSCVTPYNQCLKNQTKYIVTPYNIENSEDETICSNICLEEPSPNEYLLKTDTKIKGIFSKEYKKYGVYLTDSFNFCYKKLKDYLDFDIPNDELSIKLIIVDENGGGGSSGINNIYIYKTEKSIKGTNFVSIEEQLNKNICPRIGPLTHELMHIFVRNTIIAHETAINEGLADYMQNNIVNKGINDPYSSPIICHKDSYQYITGKKHSYANLSSKDNSFTQDFYKTAACFWDYIYTTFGETKFKSVLKYINSTRYKSGNYYIFDEFEKILGEDISDVANERFGLKKDLKVEIK